MKTFLILTTILALALARPQFEKNTRDDDGNYHFGFNDGQTAKQELRTADGIIRGAYTYVDGNNEIQKVSYTSDPFNGFQVVGTNIPVGPNSETPSVIVETPEIIDSVAPLSDEIISVDLPQPVQETPEVAAARAAHLEAIKEARLIGNTQEIEVTRSNDAPGSFLSAPQETVAPDFYTPRFGV